MLGWDGIGKEKAVETPTKDGRWYICSAASRTLRLFAAHLHAMRRNIEPWMRVGRRLGTDALGAEHCNEPSIVARYWPGQRLFLIVCAVC
jgi:hypothetical protein